MLSDVDNYFFQFCHNSQGCASASDTSPIPRSYNGDKMNTHYITYILRLRLDASGSLGMAERRVFGSLQQAGLQEIHYFDSTEKLHETLRELLPNATIPFENADQQSAEDTRS